MFGQIPAMIAGFPLRLPYYTTNRSRLKDWPANPRPMTKVQILEKAVRKYEGGLGCGF